MEIITLDVQGFLPAILSARAAMKSYEKSDTYGPTIGDADQELLRRLVKAGSSHCKCIRQIFAWFTVNAPRFWWQEFDTYRVGVEKGSESTMHTIYKRSLTASDFDENNIGDLTLNTLNVLIDEYRDLTNPDALIELKRRLPEGFLQQRFVVASYQALRGIYHQRKNHKLKHWREFCDWITTLPYSWIITE